ncbi:MAG TPA: hypothetical protein VK209_09275 [Candidatus Sulfotelmatobacter sp.]|nr:hypothetical protein [Candidatus Sulfotelmatobacter sp.]
MENEDIITKIKDWCFSQESQIINDHNLFQSYLVNFLKQNQWYTYKEYEINNYPKQLTEQSIEQATNQPSTGSTTSEKVKDRTEFLDICAFAHNKKLAIEYDNTTHIKTSSIAKLLYSNADLPIAIVHGKFGKAFLKFENTSKIKRTAKNLNITNKTIYLIVIENRIAEWVQV